MKPLFRSALAFGAMSVFSLFPTVTSQSAPVLLNTNLQIRLVMNTTNSSGQSSVRIARDPRNNQLYYLKINGDIYRVVLQPGSASFSTRVYNASDHGLSSNVEGFAIGPDGTIYVLGNINTNGTMTFARISKGVPNASGVRIWSTLARTEPYPRTQSGVFDHLYNALIVSPDGQFLYVNAGSRTDHGEEQNNGGLYPGLRDVPLTAKIFRLPASGSNLVLTNDLTTLSQAGYLYAQGVRNSFDFGFAPNGDLFATENGPDRDMSEELNWIRPGLHFGFPWRLGGGDNPQQFPTYDPSTDKLLDSRFYAVSHGFYHNDPTFPPPPTNFAEPVINLGPDADSYRDPADGTIKDASSLGQTLATFTAHRSPLGLVFDTLGAMAPPFQNHGFMLSWSPGDPNGNSFAGPFKDASQDMVDLNLTKLGNTNYQATVTRLIGGFSNPIDSEIIGNRIYVIEFGGTQGIWEVTFPPASPTVILTAPSVGENGVFGFNVSGTPGLSYEIDSSSNLLNWLPVTSLISTSSLFQFSDAASTNAPQLFYRAIQH